jgi:hypothetical protein
LNSETNKESHKLSYDDKQQFKDIHNTMQQIIKNENEIKSKVDKWTENSKAQIKHDINLNNDVSKEIVKQVAPEVADTFKKESATVKESTKKIEDTFNKFNNDITRYKNIFVIGIVAFFVLACLILLITAVTNGIFDFLGVSHLYEAISTKLKASHGFMSVIWFITYFIPVFIWTGIVVLLGHLTRKYML